MDWFLYDRDLRHELFKKRNLWENEIPTILPLSLKLHKKCFPNFFEF